MAGCRTRPASGGAAAVECGGILMAGLCARPLFASHFHSLATPHDFPRHGGVPERTHLARGRTRRTGWRRRLRQSAGASFQARRCAVANHPSGATPQSCTFRQALRDPTECQLRAGQRGGPGPPDNGRLNPASKKLPPNRLPPNEKTASACAGRFSGLGLDYLVTVRVPTSSMVTRRFFARPSRVALLAAGWVSPLPSV